MIICQKKIIYNFFVSKSFFKRKVLNSQTLEINGFKIDIEFKKIKKLYLKILNKNCQIKITAPINFSLPDIIKFVNEKEVWLNKALIKAQKHQRQNQINLQENQIIKIFNEDFIFKFIYQSARPKIYLSQQNQESLIIFDSQKPINNLLQKKLLTKFLRQNLNDYILSILPEIEEKTKIKAQKIFIKKMQTRYGSCNVLSKTIWMSEKLIHYPKEFVKYVLVHEFTHFFVPNHSPKFYKLISGFMPNFREVMKLNID